MNKGTVVSENRIETNTNLKDASAVNLKQLPLSGNYFDRLWLKSVSDLSCQSLCFYSGKENLNVLIFQMLR